MELTDLSTIKNLAKNNGIQPSRQNGQNFLINKETLVKIIDVANLNKNDKVLEIGPGFGTLTLELIKTGAQVYSFEIDKRLTSFLKRYEKLYPNFKVFNLDILKSWEVLNDEFEDLDYKLVSNLPYNITSRVLRNFTEILPRPKEMIIMIQKEVAERVVAVSGAMSILTVAVQFYGYPEKIFDVPSDYFWPQPEIVSSVLKISAIGMDANGYLEQMMPLPQKDFFRTVKIGFSAKRKQLHNNLSNGYKIKNEKASEILLKIGINPSTRAQDLTIKDWIVLTKEITKEQLNYI